MALLGNIDIAGVLIWYVALLFSLCVHEAAHAIVANRCGDPTARLMGRATLNPIAHIDPFGTVVMPLLMAISNSPFLVGWAKPVPYNPRNLNNIRRDPLLIALAGPVSNLCLATVSAIALRFVYEFGGMGALDSPVGRIVFSLVMLNLLLMVFNLIPVPPLDGRAIVSYFLPDAARDRFEQIGPFGIIIVILLINFTGILSGPYRFFQDLILGMAFFGAH